MPLPNPILDDRSFAQLRDELIRRIPVYNPEWTDHNASDPGITLIELFSYLGENLLYRFNQIPEATKLTFLRMLQLPLAPPRAAAGIVTFSAKAVAGVLVETATEVKAGSISFSTETEARALPVSFRSFIKRTSSAPTEGEEQLYFQQSLERLGLPIDANVAAFETSELLAPGEGDPLDVGAAIDRRLWIAVLVDGDFDPADVRDAWSGDEGMLLNVGFVPDAEAPTAFERDACPGEGAHRDRSSVEWRASTGSVVDGKPVYASLRVAGDETGGFARSGVVRLELPADATTLGPFADPDVEGAYDFPPPIDDETKEKLLFWCFAFVDEQSTPPRVLHVAPNGASVTQSVKARAELLGTGNGQPEQTFSLVHPSPLSGTVALQVEEPDGWREWSEVDSFDASGESSRHFVLDREGGVVRFGNGIRGQIPQVGQRVRVTSYRYGGGAAGNVAAGAITKVARSGVKVTNPLPATGGADREAIANALDRIPSELRRRDRAVTRGDFRELALITPGVHVGRAECLPRYFLHVEAGKEAVNAEAPGVVTVVVWPKEDVANPDAPRPTRPMLDAVCAWLDTKRLITTELYVVPPTYRRIAVMVGFEIKDGFGIEAVRRWVELVLRQYLAPLPPYGPEGEGWPLGRAIHAAELEAAAVQVDGVRFLNGLRVAEWRGGAWNEVEVVELAAHEVPALDSISVVNGENTLDPGASPAAPSGGPAIPIPVLVEEC